MHFQLFLPCKQAEFESYVKQAGVVDLFGGHDVLPVVGPNNLDGLLIAWLKPGDRHQYKPEDQTWIPSLLKREDGIPFYFVGVWNASPPTESELRRHYTQEGQRIQFGVEKWKLPTPSTVDARAVYNDDGMSMRWEPIRQFAWMCDEKQTLHDKYFSEGIRLLAYEVNPYPETQWLLKLLRVNYRLTPELAEHMELFVRRRHILDTFLETIDLSLPKEK